jgi:DNA-binding LacI/PurR family transcriptional regulator
VQALRKRKLAVDPELLRPVPFVAERSRAETRAMLASKLEFDGIFACSDVLALTAISTLLEAGRRVPDDVAVVGYDDIDMAAYAHPSLTTVRQPIAAGADALVNALLTVIQGRRGEPVVLETELIKRASA